MSEIFHRLVGDFRLNGSPRIPECLNYKKLKRYICGVKLGTVEPQHSTKGP